MITALMALNAEVVPTDSFFGQLMTRIDSWTQLGPVSFLISVVTGLLIVDRKSVV